MKTEGQESIVYVITHKDYPLVTPIKEVAEVHGEAITVLTGDKVDIKRAPYVTEEAGAVSALMAMLVTESLTGGL